MLNWASRFNICLFLDSHAYRIAPHTFECLLAVGASEQLRVPADRVPDPFSLLEEFARKNNSEWLFGHVGYDAGTPSTLPGKALSDHPDGVPPAYSDPIGFPDLFFFVPETVIELNKDHLRIGVPAEEAEQVERQATIIFQQILDSPSRARGPAVTTQEPLQSKFTREEYIETIQRLRAHILRGDCYEINFCQEFFADGTVLDPIAVYLALSEASPTPFGAFYRLDDHYLFCASPERYLACKAGKLFSQPIKGTSPRNLPDPEQDRLNRENLYHSEKDRAENVMVVDLVRNDLSRVCLPGSVRVEELYGIYSFPQVHQMISTISGELLPGMGLGDCLRETFPMGSMTGAPKKRVMELIAQYERSRRGLFSGAVGYALPGSGADARDFDFNVVIRSIFYNRASRHLSYQVGSGITFNSEPEKEYEECLLKAQAIRKVLDGEG